MKGEVKKGKRGKRGRPEEERGGKNEGTKAGGKGARKHTRKNSDFGTPMIEVLCTSGLSSKTSAKQKRNSGCDSQPCPRPRLIEL